jgi:hypothetical protein
MGKVIEFYVPERFRRRTPQEGRKDWGKVIAFHSVDADANHPKNSESEHSAFATAALVEFPHR